MAATALSGPAVGQLQNLFAALEPQPVILPLCEIERRAIIETLRYTKGDHSTAAHLLGIGRTTLYRKLKEYRLEDQAAPEPKPLGSASEAVPYSRVFTG